MPYREEDEKRHLKVMGDLGQIIPMVRGTVLNVFEGPGLLCSRNGISGMNSKSLNA